MTREPHTGRPRRHALALGAFVFLAVTFTTGRFHIRSDAAQMCEAARSLVDHGGLDVSPTRGDEVMGPDGVTYTKYPLASVLQCVPAVGLQSLGTRVDRALGHLGDVGHLGETRDANSSRPITWLLTGVTPAFVLACLALVFFFLARELGFSLWVATAGALLLTFTTPAWAHGRELYGENLQALLVLAALWSHLAALRTGRRGLFVLTGALFGMALNAKVPLVILPVAAVVHLLLAKPDAGRVRSFFAYGAVGALPFAAALLWYNQLRYGSVFELGYVTGRDASLGFSVPLWAGLHGLLFGSGKSIFIYAPVLLLVPVGLAPMWRRRRQDLLLIGIPAAFIVVLMAKWWSGLGDWGWGPRLLVPVMPLLMIPVLPVLARRSPWRRVLGALAALGLVVNFLGMIVDHSHYLWVMKRVTAPSLGVQGAPGPVQDDLVLVHFVPQMTPPVGHGWLLREYLDGEQWTTESSYPWEGIGIPAWRPDFDPTPPSLNHWSDGSAAATGIQAIGGGLALLTGVLLWLPWWRARKHGVGTR